MSFHFMNDYTSKMRLETAHMSLTKLNLWDWIKNYNSNKRVGCIFNDHPNFKMIEKEIYNIITENNIDSKIIHDGYSWNWTMSIMEYVANNNIETFRTTFVEPIIT